MSIVMGSSAAPIGAHRNRNSYRQIKPLIRIGVGSPLDAEAQQGVEFTAPTPLGRKVGGD